MSAEARMHLLKVAMETVAHSRSDIYGPPDRDFANIAAMWSVILETKVNAGDVAKCMIALKLSRLMHTPGHMDSWLDIAGYAACGFEVTNTDSTNAAAVDSPEAVYRDQLDEDIKYRHLRP